MTTPDPETDLSDEGFWHWYHAQPNPFDHDRIFSAWQEARRRAENILAKLRDDYQSAYLEREIRSNPKQS